MEIKDKNNIFSYLNNQKDLLEKKSPNIINNSFFLNRLDILEKNLNSNLKLRKNILNDLNQNLFSFNYKKINIDPKNLYKDKILNEMKYIKNKIYKDKLENKKVSDKIKNSLYQNNELNKKFIINSTKENKNKTMLIKKINNCPKTFSYIKTTYNNIIENYYHKNTQLNPELKDELKYFQKIYYSMDKVANKEVQIKNEKNNKFCFNDYADKTIIYNHPQLYYINKNKNYILPKLNFSIKKRSLTENIPYQNEILKDDLIKLKYYNKIKKNKKPIFFA